MNMIHAHEITIGSILRTNKGEIIRVESISTKHQHRKVGYHRPNDPYHIKYVRLAQCEGIEITPEIIEKNFHFECYWDSSRSNPLGSVTEWRLDTDKAFIFVRDFRDDVLEYDLEIKIRGCKMYGVRESVKYFHQLQSALHCAGLHELADNLKV